MINLFDFTYCGDYNRQIQNLARMVPEKWSFSDTDDNGILKGYLEHTFKRLYEEQKVWEKKNYAIFNTGLFNYYYQPIYAYFIPNLVPDRQPWFLDGFYTEYYLLKEGITCLPEKACYVENPSDLVFDTKLPVIPQYYNHSIQLLLPICLRHPGKPDLALACMKTSDGSKYLGRTCLTLRMAYHNARLLARVDRSWLMTSVSA